KTAQGGVSLSGLAFLICNSFPNANFLFTFTTFTEAVSPGNTSGTNIGYPSTLPTPFPSCVISVKINSMLWFFCTGAFVFAIFIFFYTYSTISELSTEKELCNATTNDSYLRAFNYLGMDKNLIMGTIGLLPDKIR